VPAPGALDLRGIEDRVDPATLDLLLRVDPQDWAHELADQRAFYTKFGDRLPREILRQHGEVLRRLGLES
jgi:GTP-dependent phosphoenolpyruvate carboxykinase